MTFHPSFHEFELLDLLMIKGHLFPFCCNSGTTGCTMGWNIFCKSIIRYSRLSLRNVYSFISNSVSKIWNWTRIQISDIYILQINELVLKNENWIFHWFLFDFNVFYKISNYNVKCIANLYVWFLDQDSF